MKRDFRRVTWRSSTRVTLARGIRKPEAGGRSQVFWRKSRGRVPKGGEVDPKPAETDGHQRIHAPPCVNLGRLGAELEELRNEIAACVWLVAQDREERRRGRHEGRTTCSRAIAA